MDKFDYSDIVPMELDESKAQLGQIMYSAEYKHVMGILKSLLKKKEYSARALAVTESAIEANPAHYTVWEYRYEIIKDIASKQKSESDKISYIEAELSHNEGFAINNPKNYQIWHYRELLIRLNPNASAKKEFPLIEAIIIEDMKNYHTWSYRIWLVEYFDLFKSDREIEFVNALLNKDIYNNSAWNFRFFLKFTNLESLSEEDVEQEISFVKSCIVKEPQNSSSWTYLQGMYEKLGRDLLELEDLCLRYITLDIQDEDVEPLVESIPAAKLLQQIYGKSDPQKCLKVLKVLESCDPVREQYWKYRASCIEA